MTTADAQHDLRHAYLHGAPGIFASALAWLVAGIVALQATANAAVIALFIGGMLIHPVGVVLCKLAGRPGQHSRGNPLGALALENTGWLLLSLPLAYAVSRLNPLWFFPAMMLIIGGRYLTFQTLYGLRTYWVLGGVLAIAAWLLIRLQAPVHVGAFTGAAIELGFAGVLWGRSRREAAA